MNLSLLLLSVHHGETVEASYGTARTAAHTLSLQAPELSLPTHWPAQVDLLDWCQHMGPGMAVVLILLGVVYLLFGLTLFKALVVLNAACAGALLGAALGQRSGAALPVGVVVAVLSAAVTWPLMKYAVAVMGGTFGAMLGATVWRMFGQDPNFTWAGALTGLVGGGLLCFILFRGCVMAYTSLQGSVMLIFGILGLLFKYQEVAPHVGGYLTVKPFLLPLCVFVPTVIGVMYQHAGGAAKATPPPATKK